MSKNTDRKLTDRQRACLAVLCESFKGSGYSAAFIGRKLNPSASMAHLGAVATLRSLEAVGLAKRRMSNSWSTGHDIWSPTSYGRVVQRGLSTAK